MILLIADTCRNMSRFPATHDTNGKAKDGRGIGSHTDYGLLVIAAADEVGGKTLTIPMLASSCVMLTTVSAFHSPSSQERVFRQLEEECRWFQGRRRGMGLRPPHA